MREFKLVHRVLAALTFVVALITYTMTLQPSVPFWDCGEFSAATVWQQVPHPPGAPLWLIVAKFFHLFGIGDPGWRLNFFSGVCTAVTVMLVYLIVVQAMNRFMPPRADRKLSSYLPTFGGALIAALAFAWSDTNWFNAVESEVYAAGNLLIALVIWLMMRWDAEAERAGHDRYLLAIAYLLGLAFGVHLLALLTVPSVALVIYFRRYQPTAKTFIILMAITAVAFWFIVYKAPLEYIPKLLAGNAVIGIVVLAAIVGLVWWAVRERKAVVYLAGMSFLLIFLGYSSYTQILLRANAHPPMNENEPDTFSELVSYLGREQYGNRGAWPRRQETDQYYRQYQDAYGEWFPPVGQNDDGTYRYDNVNASGEMNFMMKYQITHMYLRYLAWNFIGRVSDVQDAGVSAFSASDQEKKTFIEGTGMADYFPITFFGLPLLLGIFGIYWHYKRDWKMALVFTSLFLFLGLLPTLQQNQQQPQPRERDYFYVGSFMIYAMWVGIGAAGIAEIMRERRRQQLDAAGAENASGSDRTVGVVGAVLAVCFLAAPVNMVVGGWKLHDRSGNWVPWDYAYNILQSCEKDAILFTNGDNDTFPLWYLQDVAGVRRDIRVVNLSLGNTLWYIWQLKNERPWGAKQVPITFADDMLRVSERDPRALSYDVAPPPDVSIAVPANVMSWATHDSIKTAGTMTWTLRGGNEMGQGQQLIRVQDKLIRNIMENNKWQRPVYFSSTVGGDAWAGLQDYFRSEGMAFRVMPVRQAGVNTLETINTDVTSKCLMTVLKDDEWYTEPHYGFKFRNLNNRSVTFMEDHRRIPNLQYRPMFLGLAMQLSSDRHDSKGAVAVLDRMEQTISADLFPIAFPYLAQIAETYKSAGAMDKARAYAQRALDAISKLGNDWSGNMYARQYNPILARAHMLGLLGRYDEAMDNLRTLQQTYGNDPALVGEMENMRIERFLSKNDTAGARREIEAMIKEYDANPAMAEASARLRQRLVMLGGAPQAAPSDNTSIPKDSGASGANTSGAIAR